MPKALRPAQNFKRPSAISVMLIRIRHRLYTVSVPVWPYHVVCDVILICRIRASFVCVRVLKIQIIREFETSGSFRVISFSIVK